MRTLVFVVAHLGGGTSFCFLKFSLFANLVSKRVCHHGLAWPVGLLARWFRGECAIMGLLRLLFCGKVHWMIFSLVM